MKHAYNYILLSALLICNSAHLFAEKRVSYLDQIGIRNEEVVKEGKEIRVSLQFDLGQLKIKTQHTIALTPVLVSRDGSRERVFPPVVIDGRTRNMVYLRARQFESVDLPPYHDESAREIIRRRNGQDQTCDYQATAPYERWMLNGRIELRINAFHFVINNTVEDERTGSASFRTHAFGFKRLFSQQRKKNAAAVILQKIVIIFRNR